MFFPAQHAQLSIQQSVPLVLLVILTTTSHSVAPQIYHVLVHARYVHWGTVPVLVTVYFVQQLSVRLVIQTLQANVTAA